MNSRAYYIYGQQQSATTAQQQQQSMNFEFTLSVIRKFGKVN